MPTTLPVRTRPLDAATDLLGFLRALAFIYGLLASATTLIVSLESACGLFEGRTLAASILIATGTELQELDNARVDFAALRQDAF
jgi:hypothetical protein